MSDDLAQTRDFMRDGIAAIYGFTAEQFYNCLGLSYIEAEREAKARYEAKKESFSRHAEQICDSLNDRLRSLGFEGNIRFGVSDLLSR